ncbi:uncharacterized protein KY384_002126 [Bacidia gigantensis]|uniref:uncharacterized protein n=1 Tax=Bacidia gigantensis TaxID=2732470 RepID=UPI001D04FD21|nr:uncharacterized protein KY384_002126 [Bacidia gigantensis]KAG8533343.1 hypothetical protein KY384_002126 [Bacidia gigantensis]
MADPTYGHNEGSSPRSVHGSEDVPLTMFPSDMQIMENDLMNLTTAPGGQSTFFEEPAGFNLDDSFELLTSYPASAQSTSQTVSPKDVMIDSMSAPPSTTMTNLTTPDTSTYDSPYIHHSTEASPFYKDEELDGSDSWHPLFEPMEEQPQGAPMAHSLSNNSSSSAVPHYTTSPASVTASPAPSMSRTFSSPGQKASNSGRQHSFTSGVRKREKPLPVITVKDPNDTIAVKRARNTMAARKSRQKRLEQKENLVEENESLRQQLERVEEEHQNASVTSSRYTFKVMNEVVTARSARIDYSSHTDLESSTPPAIPMLRPASRSKEHAQKSYQPFDDRRRVRIIVVGAGPSGLLFAYKVQQSFSDLSLTIYEKSPEVSGTWYANSYPGCTSDIPSHNYTFSFEPKHDWPAPYAKATDIRTYFQGFCGKYSLSQYIKLEHVVLGARWLDDKHHWRIDVKNLRSEIVSSQTCDIFINAGGYLSHPSFPNVLDLDVYRGKLMHSAAWDQSYELTGKKVALIGNGASGVQILPAIQPYVKNVTFFMRSPTWILPPVSDIQHLYSSEELASLRDPETYNALRDHNEAIINDYFDHYFRGSPQQHAALSHYNQRLRTFLPPHLPRAHLFPDSGSSCRRLTAGAGYLQSLSAQNVITNFGSVTSLTHDGCIDSSGTPHADLDAIICATGFDTTSIPQIPIIGLDGMNMQASWRPRPRSYLGVAADKFPNLFTLLGPYSPTVNGTVLPALEAQVDYILLLVEKWSMESDIRYLMPKREVVDDFLAHHGRYFGEKPWLRRFDPEEDGFKGPWIWPGTTLQYIQTLKESSLRGWDSAYDFVRST